MSKGIYLIFPLALLLSACFFIEYGRSINVESMNIQENIVMETRSVSENDALFKTQVERQQGIYLLFDNGQGPYLPDLKNSHNSEHVEYRYMAIRDDRGIFLRDKEAYETIIDQFYVKNGPRYIQEKDTKKTWCNFFMADVLGACGLVMFQEYSYFISGPPFDSWGDYSDFCLNHDTTKFNANALYNYFLSDENQKRHGVVQVPYKTAQAFANAGIPTFGLLWREGRSGHCIIVAPLKKIDDNDKHTVIAIAQASSENECYSYKKMNAANYSGYDFYVHVKDEYLPFKLLYLIKDDMDEVKEINEENMYLKEQYEFFEYWFFE